MNEPRTAAATRARRAIAVRRRIIAACELLELHGWLLPGQAEKIKEGAK